MSRGLTRVCGLKVAGALAPIGRTAIGTADLVMEAGPVTGGGAGLLFDNLETTGNGVGLHQIGDRTLIRFHGLGDAVLDLGAGTATIELLPSAPAGMEHVLAAGPVIALALSLRGHPILHASAVSVAGRAVAFAAPSGGGKTTLAALACMGGAEQVSDDTLVLESHDDGLRCLPGDRELRLRPVPAELLAGTSWPRRMTADGRVAVLVGNEELAPPALAAVIIPAITVDGTEGVERLQGAAATAALLACSRLVNLAAPNNAESMLDLAATLTRRIPVYRVTMPRLTTPHLPEPIQLLLEDHLG